MAGHSKWANIKHKKARNDAKRGKVWSKCSRAIIVAAKNGGGDPDSNLTLRYAIDDAKANNMPKDTIENAIRKGSGEAGGADYESIVYEGYGPGGVAVMLDILTDNRNRTAGEVRRCFDKGGGKLGSSGCVSYLFQSRGQIFIEKKDADEEAVMMTALEAGADDVRDDDEEYFEVLTEPGNLAIVKDALDAAEIPVESSSLAMIPDTMVAVPTDEAKKLLNLIDALEDQDDVQKVHTNADFPEEALAAMDG